MHFASYMSLIQVTAIISYFAFSQVMDHNAVSGVNPPVMARCEPLHNVIKL